MIGAMPDTIAALAYEESKRSIDEQRAALEALRGRSVTLVSVAALAVSLSSALGGKGLGWLIAVCFAVLAAFCGLTLYPWKWRFSNSIEQLILDSDKALAGEPVDVDKALRDWAWYQWSGWQDNREKLGRLFKLHAAAVVVFGLQLGATVLRFA